MSNLSQIQLNKEKIQIVLSLALIFTAITLGAMASHYLKTVLSVEHLETFKVGVTYHMYSGLGLLAWLALARAHAIEVRTSFWFILVGVCLFSGCCYLYALTGLVPFAMVVPMGGVAMMIGWLVAILEVIAPAQAKR